jgi:tight adherence protein C
MTEPALVLSVGLLFSSTAILTFNIASAARVATARGPHAPRADHSEVTSLLFRLAFPISDRLAPLFKRIKWPRYRAAMVLELRRAGMGDSMTFEHLFVMKVMAALFVPLLLSRVFATMANPALFVLAAIGCFFLPDRFVSDLRKAREHRILRAMPGTVDVLSLLVESGLEFLTAMQRLVERGGIGPLRDELTTILNDIRLGQARAEALKSFARRVEIPEVSSFVAVLVQADMLGASIGPVLQQQAERMRVERFQRAEKAGARATQKILVPLVLCIFPAVLIVIIGPVVLQFLYAR